MLPKDLQTPALKCVDEFIKCKTLDKDLRFRTELESLVNELRSAILFGGRSCGKTTALRVVFRKLLPKIVQEKLLVLPIDFLELFGRGPISYEHLCQRFVGRLHKVLAIYNIPPPPCLSGFDFNKETPTRIFYSLPFEVAKECGFKGLFLLQDDIEHTVVRYRLSLLPLQSVEQRTGRNFASTGCGEEWQ